jgi:hypothetical protein
MVPRFPFLLGLLVRVRVESYSCFVYLLVIQLAADM